MLALTKYWKLLGPIFAVVIASANLLGPQWKPGYVIAGILAMIVNLVSPPNTPVGAQVVAPPPPPA